MASEQQVKQYLAYWFLLGKKLIFPHQKQGICPSKIYDHGDYSAEFKQCWQKIVDPKNKDAYLEGTEQSINDLLSSKWDIIDCANCKMPVPIISLGVQTVGCPCADLDLWPNTELPLPKSPVDTQQQLLNIRKRLNYFKTEDN
jgi:hypothetical protein